MQITIEMIERIARRVFDLMFIPSLSKANVRIDGTAKKADHADSAYKADEVNWKGVIHSMQNGMEFNMCHRSPDSQMLFINMHKKDGTDMSSPITDYYFYNGAGSPNGVTVHATVFDQSDEKLKDIKQQIVLNLDEIANAPTVLFEWKDQRDGHFHVGTIAQYWEKVLPEVVNANSKGELSLNYATAALISVVSLAKEVRELKKKLQVP